MKTAKLIKDNLPEFTGRAALYELDPPIEAGEGKKSRRVIVSSTFALFGGPETYIFPAEDAADKVADWGELEGSYKGGTDHAEALLGAGYELAQ